MKKRQAAVYFRRNSRCLSSSCGKRACCEPVLREHVGFCFCVMRVFLGRRWWLSSFGSVAFAEEGLQFFCDCGTLINKARENNKGVTDQISLHSGLRCRGAHGHDKCHRRAGGTRYLQGGPKSILRPSMMVLGDQTAPRGLVSRAQVCRVSQQQQSNHRQHHAFQKTGEQFHREVALSAFRTNRCQAQSWHNGIDMIGKKSRCSQCGDTPPSKYGTSNFSVTAYIRPVEAGLTHS